MSLHLSPASIFFTQFLTSSCNQSTNKTSDCNQGKCHYEWEPHYSFPSSFSLNSVKFKQDLVWMTGSWLLKRFSFEKGLLLANISLYLLPPVPFFFLALLLHTDTHIKNTFSRTCVFAYFLLGCPASMWGNFSLLTSCLPQARNNTAAPCPGQCHCVALPSLQSLSQWCLAEGSCFTPTSFYLKDTWAKHTYSCGLCKSHLYKLAIGLLHTFAMFYLFVESRAFPICLPVYPHKPAVVGVLTGSACITHWRKLASSEKMSFELVCCTERQRLLLMLRTRAAQTLLAGWIVIASEEPQYRCLVIDPEGVLVRLCSQVLVRAWFFSEALRMKSHRPKNNRFSDLH